MSVILFANRASSTLVSPITNTATSITVAPGTGALYPNPGAGEYYVGTFIDAATGLNTEIVHVTARSGDIMTIVRAQEGTTAQAWNAGDFFRNFWTAGSAEAMLQQGQSPPSFFGVDSGTTNAIVLTLSPAPGALSDLLGVPVFVKLSHTSTGATTINVNSLGAKNVTFADLGAIVSGTMVAGSIVQLLWDGTQFQYTDQFAPATVGQVQAGTDNLHAMTAAGLAGAMAFVHGTSGYQKMPNGTIIQWGRIVSATGNGDHVTFPIPFPTDCSVTTTIGSDGSAIQNLVNIFLASGPFTGFIMWTWQFSGGAWVITPGLGVGWIAIGY